jgi:hypothetical protein
MLLQVFIHSIPTVENYQFWELRLENDTSSIWVGLGAKRRAGKKEKYSFWQVLGEFPSRNEREASSISSRDAVVLLSPCPLQAVINIIACQYYSATNLVVAQDAEVENPCLICTYDGAISGDVNDYVPYHEYAPRITCKEIIDNATLFETGSLWCARFGEAGFFCCPTPPDDPCTLCPNGITVAYNYEPYNNGDTCSVLLDYYYANFDAESDWCTVGRRASDIESRSVRPLLHLSAQIRRYPMISYAYKAFGLNTL